jgi:hypothetical protein
VSNKMVITVSDVDGIKQFNAPKSIKTILLFLLLLLILSIMGTFFYIKTLNDKVNHLEVLDKGTGIHLENNMANKKLLDKKEMELAEVVKQLKSEKSKYEKLRVTQLAQHQKTELTESSTSIKQNAALQKMEKEKNEAQKRFTKEKQALEDSYVQKIEALQVKLKMKNSVVSHKVVPVVQSEDIILLKKRHLKEKAALENSYTLKIQEIVIGKNRILSEKRHLLEEKLEGDKLLRELTIEIKKVEKELEEEIKIKEDLKKQLSLKKKAKREKLAHEKVRSIRLAKGKVKREKLLEKIAKAKLGKRYVWGAVGPGTFDCSGFTSYVYKKVGVNIPRTSRVQSKYGKFIKRGHLKKGDLIFFDTSRGKKGFVNHVGIYLGNNKFIHASSAKKRVVITSLAKPFYSSRYKCARRVN